MRIPIHPLRRSSHLAGLALATLLGTVVAPVHTEPASDAELVERLNYLRAQVAEQQVASNHYSPKLLSALQQLSEALLAANALDESAETLEQQIQLIKVNEGLYSDLQFPIIFQQLGILAARGNWSELADRVQYLTWLLERADEQGAEQRLRHLKQTRDWVRLLLLQAPSNHEAQYLRQWTALEHAAIAVGQETAVDRDTMQALLYDAAIAELYIALAIVTPGPTSQQLIQMTEGEPQTLMRPPTRVTTVSDIEAIYGARTSTVIDRAFNRSMGRHRQMIERLAELYTSEEEEELADMDPEAAAMLQLYLGDSILLRQQYEPRSGSHLNPSRGSNSTGLAATHYEQAWQLLLDAGYTEEALNDYFRCPALLPLPAFSSRLNGIPPACQIEDETVVYPAFAANRRGVPGLPYGGIPDSPLIAPPEGTSAQIMFQVGLNGQADRLQYGESNPDSTSSRVRARDIIQSLQFRPALVNGRPVRTESATMQVISLETR